MEGRFVTGPQSSNSAANDGCAHEWEGIGQIDRRCKRCGKVESGLEASQSWPPVGRVIPNRVEDHNRRGKFGVSSVTMRPLDFAQGALGDIAAGHTAPKKLAAVVNAEIDRFLNGVDESFPPKDAHATPNRTHDDSWHTDEDKEWEARMNDPERGLVDARAQSQDSLSEQLERVRQMAIAAGEYDAADFIYKAAGLVP
jgi:hypothetical protein